MEGGRLKESKHRDFLLRRGLDISKCTLQKRIYCMQKLRYVYFHVFTHSSFCILSRVIYIEYFAIRPCLVVAYKRFKMMEKWSWSLTGGGC